MERIATFFFLLLFIGSGSCSSNEDTPSLPGQTTQLETNFNNGTAGWLAEVTDYSTAQENLIEFRAVQTTIPNLIPQRGYLLSGHNRSDDLFMFLKKKLTGLPANTTYRATFEIELASKYSANSIGIGGSPGTSVFLKAGASPNEPVKSKDAGNFYKVSWDKGFQSQGGKDMVVLGDVSTPGDKEVYQIISRNSTSAPLTVNTNAQGELWVAVGTDSGFEGVTALYYTRIKINLN